MADGESGFIENIFSELTLEVQAISVVNLARNREPAPIFLCLVCFAECVFGMGRFVVLR